MNIRFANRVAAMQASEVREAYKIAYLPGMITFGSGSPDPATFPMEELKRSADRVLGKFGPLSIQYYMTEGRYELREKIAARMKSKKNIDVTADDIAILSGGQQGLDLAARLFVDEGDTVIFENPTYQGAREAFKAYCPTVKGVATDDEGIVPEALHKILLGDSSVKLIYVIPDFQNPTGRRWSVARRKAIIDVVRDFDVIILEDDPYGDLAFDGSQLPPLKSYDDTGKVVYLGSFSKIISPGFRVSWVSAIPRILDKFVIAKQGADLQTSTLCQLVIDDYISHNDLEAHIAEVRKVYEKRCSLMLGAIRKEFPPEVKVNEPKGGLFIWGELPDFIDGSELFRKCADNLVTYINGNPFFVEPDHVNAFRLSYSQAPEGQIHEGIRRMAKTLKAYL
ncbi:MAG: PLP-dependent aminotransferase family protein [Clostridiales Family XIII bacterium]|nr:PLP-dependent aminotransferase family protein [Clostridiales Family XIII bacterium]